MNNIARTCLYLKQNKDYILLDIFKKFIDDKHDFLCVVLNRKIFETAYESGIVESVNVAPYCDFRIAFYNANEVLVLWTNEIFSDDSNKYYLCNAIYDVFMIWAENNSYFQKMVDEYIPIITGLELNIL